MSLQPQLNRIEFQQRFSTQEACERALFESKWPEGFVCPRCGGKHHYTISTRNHPLYECSACGYQASATAGTIFEKTHTPLPKWFSAIYAISTDKRGYSSLQLSKDVGVSHATAWQMLHKIREGMSNRDKKYLLSGTVEMDEAYFGAPEKGGKRGRGASKTPVLAALSLDALDHPQYARLEAAAGVSGEDPRKFAVGGVAPGSTIKSDAFSSYKKLEDLFKVEQIKYDIKNNPENLKWLLAVISNAKAFINGAFHGLGDKYFQRCLNEFCYRFNRRKFKGQGFFRLLSACASSKTIILRVLIA